MYLAGDSFRVSFKWVVIISTKQEAGHTQSAKVSTCYTFWHFGDWSLITGRGATKRQWGARFSIYDLVFILCQKSGNCLKKILT